MRLVQVHLRSLLPEQMQRVQLVPPVRLMIKISDPDSYPYKVDFTLSGYTGSSTLTQFPVLLKFDSGITGFSYNSFASPTAGDLRFFASTGEELPYEIESWDKSGVSRVWVRVGSISGTNTKITAAWGDASKATAPNYVFDGSAWSNGYQGLAFSGNVRRCSHY